MSAPRPLAPALVVAAALSAASPAPLSAQSPSDTLGATGVSEKVTGTLERRGPTTTGGGRVLSARPRAIALAGEAPVEFAGLPRFRSARPLYGAIRLARERKIYFALDQSEPATPLYDVLVIDLDRDRDLSDETPIEGTNRVSDERARSYTEFPIVTVDDLYYSGDVKAPYSFLLYAWYPPEGPLDRLFLSAATWCEGTIDLKGTEVRLCLFDENADAQFDSTNESWSLTVGADAAGARHRPEQRHPIGVPLRVGGLPWRIQSASADGLVVSLETETEHETVQAELAADPLLLEPPRDSTDAEILWVTDVDLARRAARSEEKRLFYLFTADWPESAKRLRERTLRDKEVVEVLGEYVCVRKNPERDAELAKALGATVPPTCLVVDADGRVLARQIGYIQARSFAAWLRENRR